MKKISATEKLNQQLEALNRGETPPRFSDSAEEADLAFLARTLISQGNKKADEETIARVREELPISAPDLETEIEDLTGDRKSFWTFQMAFSMASLVLILGVSAWFYFYQSNKIAEVAKQNKVTQDSEILIGENSGGGGEAGDLPEAQDAADEAIAIAKLEIAVDKYNASLNWEEPTVEISQTVTAEKQALAEEGYGAVIAVSPFAGKTEDLVLDIQSVFALFEESLSQAQKTVESIPNTINREEVNQSFEQTEEAFNQTQAIYNQIIDLSEFQENITAEQYSELLDLADEFTQKANNFQAESQMLITKLNLLSESLS